MAGMVAGEAAVGFFFYSPEKANRVVGGRGLASGCWPSAAETFCFGSVSR